jgi:hypothetical protein
MTDHKKKAWPMDTIFYMWGGRREMLIAEHNFYVAEGKSRITDQFSDNDKLEKEAKAYEDEWMAKMECRFDPDRDDLSDFCEQANEVGITFYQDLSDLGNHARLALISGMFHLWERSLRDWLTSNDGIGYWQRGPALSGAVWKSNFHQIFELLEKAGIFRDNRSRKIKESLDTCRLVVNTYKHGKGESFDELKNKRPELLDQYGLRQEQHAQGLLDYADYTHLYVTSENIDEFSKAIVGFWQEIPEWITPEDFISSVPKWFDDAYKKDMRSS